MNFLDFNCESVSTCIAFLNLSTCTFLGFCNRSIHRNNLEHLFYLLPCWHRQTARDGAETFASMCAYGMYNACDNNGISMFAYRADV